MSRSVSLALLLICGLVASTWAQGPVVELPGLGFVQGKEKLTMGNLDYPQKTYYSFRNIPFANSVSGEKRFSQPEAFDGFLGSQTQPYDATKSGPLCPQMSLDSQNLTDTMEKPMDQWAHEIIADFGLEADIAADVLLRIVEDMLEVPVVDETVGGVLEELSDITFSMQEDCLNLAVSTPRLPTTESKQDDLLPVLFFIYGGAFVAGTQYKMGFDRLGDVNDLVVVATNYRLGPLGFMCLDSEEASGNMGLLDQITALEWVRDNIRYFGGDPDRVTIMGQSAGSASTSFLTLSPLTEGLFHQAILESGSAVSPWPYDDFAPDWHAHRIAAKVGCDQADDEAMVSCMRQVPVTQITEATMEYQVEEERRGTLGFGGITPCGQKKGAQKVFKHGDNMERILHTGNYNQVPMLAGANKDEGLLLWAAAYSNVINSTMQADAEFLKNDLLNFMLRVVHMDQGYSFSNLLQEKYFHESEFQSFQAMTAGLVDMLGVLGLKASTYRIVEENSRFQPSYFYSLEKRQRKSFHRLFCEAGNPDLPKIPGNVMAAHADELLYLFDVPLPFVLCDTEEVFTALAAAYQKCILLHPLDLAAAEACVTDPDSEFKTEWGDCVDGHLTPDEQVLSEAITRTFSNFVVYGNPTPSSDEVLPSLAPWSNENPNYMIFDTPVRVGVDYKKTYASKDYRPPGGWA